MKRKLFLLSLTFGCAVSSWCSTPAGMNAQEIDDSELILKPSIVKVLPSGERVVETPKLSPVVEMDVLKRAADKKGYRLDSVVCTKPDGSLYSRQYFIFDENGKLLKQEDAMYNAETKKWDVNNQYIFTWYDTGYRKSDEQVSASGYALRNEYKYNEQNLGIEKLTTKRANANAEYENYRKGEYEYDERGNMTLEVNYTWTNNAWVKGSETTATYDENNYRASIEVWKLQKGAWVGTEKKEYTNNADGKNTFLLNYSWERSTPGIFEPFSRLTQIFSETDPDFVVTQKFEYYNLDQQDWNGNFTDRGGAERHNMIGDKEFDEKGRVILSFADTLYGDEWVRGSYSDYEYTDNADGSYRCVKTHYLRAEGEENFRNTEILTTEVNAMGLETFNQDMVLTDIKRSTENISTYDERGNRLTSEDYKYDASGKRLCNLKAQNTYDEWNNIIETYNWKGVKGELGFNDEWGYSSHFTYTYEMDGTVRVDKRRYKYVEKSDSWENDFGDGADFDFNVLASEILLPSGYDADYMQTAKYNYKGNGDGWDATTYTYHYAKTAVDGVESVTARNSSVTFRDNTLYINGGNEIENSVYATDGKLVYTGCSSEEYLGGLGSGLYIVRSIIDGKTNVIKVVVK